MLVLLVFSTVVKILLSIKNSINYIVAPPLKVTQSQTRSEILSQF